MEENAFHNVHLLLFQVLKVLPPLLFLVSKQKIIGKTGY